MVGTGGNERDRNRGASKVVGVVLMVALTLLLATVTVGTLSGYSPGTEMTAAKLDVSYDSTTDEVLIEHASGQPIELDGGADLVVVANGETVRLDDRAPDGTFAAGEEIRVPASTLPSADELDVVLREAGDTSRVLTEYAVPATVGGGGNVGAYMGDSNANDGGGASMSDSRLTIATGQIKHAASGDTLYYQKNGLHAFDPDAGGDRWNVSRDATSNPVVHDGTVYLAYGPATERTIRGYDLETGRQVYRKSVGVVPHWLSTDGERFYGTAGGTVVAYDVDTGNEVWRYSSGGGNYNSPVVNEGTVVVSKNGGAQRTALDAETGSVVWQTGAGGSYWAPAVDGGTVFTKDGTELVAMDLSDGSVEWRADVGDAIVGSVVVRDGTAYVADRNNEVTAVNAESGTVEWSTQVASPSGSFPFSFTRNTRLTATEDAVYAGATKPWTAKLFALDRSDGSVEWSQSTDGLATVYPLDDELVIDP